MYVNNPLNTEQESLPSFISPLSFHASTFSFPASAPLDYLHPFNNSDNLVAKLCFAAGETPCFPTIDSRTASESSLFSITVFAASGTDASLEKLICSESERKRCQKSDVNYRTNHPKVGLLTVSDPFGDCVKRIEAPGGKF